MDKLGKDVHMLHLTTAYDLHGQTVCEVEKGIYYLTIVLSLQTNSKPLYFPPSKIER